MKKYMVAWHEDHASGVPKHAMGVSPVFDTPEAANEWIETCIAEDTERAVEHGESGLKVEEPVDGVRCAYDSCHTTYYKVEEVEWKDKAAECVKEVKDILDATRSTPATYISDGARVKAALIYIGEHENEWLPMRKWDVDIRFCPSGCVHSVLARTAQEAEDIVNDMIDKEGPSMFTDEQKAEMMGSLLENVESIEVVGSGDAP